MVENNKIKNPLTKICPLVIDGKMEGYLVRAPLRKRGLQTTLLEISENRTYCDFISDQIYEKQWEIPKVIESGALPPKEASELIEELGLVVEPEMVAHKVHYRCRIQESPRHLLPKRFASEKKDAVGDLIVNETYRFEPSFRSPVSKFKREETDGRDGVRCYDPDGTVVDPEDSAFALGEPCLWVKHPGTGLTLPYWIDRSDTDFFSSLHAGGKAIAPNKSLLRDLRAHSVLGTPDEFHSLKRTWDDLLQSESVRFGREKYAILPPVFPGSQLAALRRYYRQLMDEGFVGQGDDGQVSRCLSMKNETVTTFFHHQLTDLIGRITGQPMKPSYVFARRYVDEAELKYHIDREQSAVSVSMLLDYEPEPDEISPWPLYIQKSKTNKETIKVQQGIGDLVVYTGTDMPHYRHPLFKGHVSTSIFFMYVPESYNGSLY